MSSATPTCRRTTMSVRRMRVYWSSRYGALLWTTPSATVPPSRPLHLGAVLPSGLTLPLQCCPLGRSSRCIAVLWTTPPDVTQLSILPLPLLSLPLDCSSPCGDTSGSFPAVLPSIMTLNRSCSRGPSFLSLYFPIGRALPEMALGGVVSYIKPHKGVEKRSYLPRKKGL